MTLMSSYTEGEGASHALAAQLATELALANSEPVFEGEGWAVTRTGQVLDARNFGDKPWRRQGRHTVFEPDSFADLVARYATASTTLWADRESSNVVAIYNDHPATMWTGDPTEDDGTAPLSVDAGHGDHSAVLQLAIHQDWRDWAERDGKLLSQQDFAEHIEALSYTMVNPDAATMLEIASTLTMKAVIDSSSKVRLDNGDMEFKFTQESKITAGRATTVAIPQTFEFSVPVWDGTDALAFEARLRVRPLQREEGVQMGYKIIRRTETQRLAFDEVIAAIAGSIPSFATIYRGRATR